MKRIAPLASLLLIVFYTSATTPLENHETYQFKAFNGIRFEYSLLLPAAYEKTERYEIIALLCETHDGHHAWTSTMDQLSKVDLARSIIIVPKIPLGHESWGTHPIHHAFNDLLKSVRKSHGHHDQKFHLIGLEGGQEVAFWWTYGSKQLIASTSIINGALWKENHWDQKWYRNLMGSGIPIYAYEEKTPSRFDMSRIKFLPVASIKQVIQDIEQKNEP